MNMGQTPSASRCLRFDTVPKTDIHPRTLTGLFARPRGPAVLRTWYGIYKEIFVNGGRLAVHNGPVHAAASHPDHVRDEGSKWKRRRDECPEVRPGSVLASSRRTGLLNLREANSSFTYRHRNEIHKDFDEWKCIDFIVIFHLRRYLIGATAQRMWGCEISSKKCNVFFFFFNALSDNKLIFRLDGLYSWPLRKQIHRMKQNIERKDSTLIFLFLFLME